MQPMQVARPELEPPEGRDFWTGHQAVGDLPTFTMKEVATVFFGRSKIWLWKAMKEYTPDLDVPQLGANKIYQFQLFHVERLTFTLLECGIIDIARFENSLIIIKAIAKNYRLI